MCMYSGGGKEEDCRVGFDLKCQVESLYFPLLHCRLMYVKVKAGVCV